MAWLSENKRYLMATGIDCFNMAADDIVIKGIMAAIEINNHSFKIIFSKDMQRKIDRIITMIEAITVIWYLPNLSAK
jgi:hypothetical protein